MLVGGEVAMEETGVLGEVASGEENGREERRATARFDCAGSAEVAVLDAGFLFRGRILDISQTGCYIESRARLELRRSTKVELRFMVEGTSFNILARVMQVRPGKGVGFEFSLDSLQIEKSLPDLIQKLSAAVS